MPCSEVCVRGDDYELRLSLDSGSVAKGKTKYLSCFDFVNHRNLASFFCMNKITTRTFFAEMRCHFLYRILNRISLSLEWWQWRLIYARELDSPRVVLQIQSSTSQSTQRLSELGAAHHLIKRKASLYCFLLLKCEFQQSS